ncbi:MAG: hypothetical protein H6Q89_1571 [Myxococcaceae bacterium]|nr:hypothetical protein [Myxococcaceae bacterium]
MFRALLIFALTLPLVARADVDAKFARLRDTAEALSSLGAFLDKYVGDCGPISEGGGDCSKIAEGFRRGANGKKFYMILTEDSTAVLSMGAFNPQGGEVTFNLTPFFPGSNSAITHGAPSKTDANGNPVLPFITFKGVLPDTWNVQMMARQVSSRQMRLQVVFSPQGMWELPKKGGGKIRGVRAKLEAVLVTVGRTGEQVALWINK